MGQSHEGNSSCETIIAPKGVYLKGDYRRQVTEIIQSLCFQRGAAILENAPPSYLPEELGRRCHANG
jgi:hypothetical protein